MRDNHVLSAVASFISVIIGVVRSWDLIVTLNPFVIPLLIVVTFMFHYLSLLLLFTMIDWIGDKFN